MNEVLQAIANLKSLGSLMVTHANHSLKSDADISTLSSSSDQASKLESIFDHEKIDEDFSEQAFSIKTIVGQLTRISTAIRRSGAKYRHQRADISLREQEYDEFKRHLAIIILMSTMEGDPSVENDPTRSTYPRGSVDWDVIRSRVSDQKRLTTVQKRLIRANIVRRNRIIFATRSIKQIKNRILPQEDQLVIDRPQSIDFESITHVTREPRQLSTDESRPLPTLPSSTRTPSIVQSSTEIGSQFNLEALPPKKATPSVMTRVTRTGDRQDYPPCPVPLSNEFLQCQFCADLLPIEYAKNKSRWK